MCKEIENAMQATQSHDACDDCGKRTDGLMICTYAHDDSTTKLCPDCIRDSGFCLGCGHYWSGNSSFDFSDIPGYCENCRDEIKSTLGEFDDEFRDDDYPWDDDDDHFEPCDHCDLPDACADFGCAIKTGVRKDYPMDGIF